MKTFNNWLEDVSQLPGYTGAQAHPNIVNYANAQVGQHQQPQVGQSTISAAGLDKITLALGGEEKLSATYPTIWPKLRFLATNHATAQEFAQFINELLGTTQSQGAAVGRRIGL